MPQEAIIGTVYAVSAAAAVLAVDRAPQSGEHIKQILVGSILTVTPSDVGTLALLYAPIGALHWLVRRPLLDISFDPDGAGARRAVGLLQPQRQATRDGRGTGVGRCVGRHRADGRRRTVIAHFAQHFAVAHNARSV